MKIISISYEKVFPIAPYQNEKIGVEISLDNGDSAEHGIALAKQMVNEWGMQKQIQNTVTPSITPQYIDPPHRDEVENDYPVSAALIQNAQTIDVLARIKAGLPKELMPQYMAKLKSLTPKVVNV